MLLLLIKYVLLTVKRRWGVDISLSTLAAVILLSMGLLIIVKTAGDAAPRDEFQIALLR